MGKSAVSVDIFQYNCHRETQNAKIYPEDDAKYHFRIFWHVYSTASIR